MPLFMWKKSYEIGVQKIDDQHQQLVSIINELADAMKFKEGHSIVEVILDSLLDYVQFHFTSEEEVMREIDFPDYKDHCNEHLQITRKVLEFNKTHKNDHKIDMGEFLNFLCDWLRKHLVMNDSKIGEYIKNLPK